MQREFLEPIDIEIKLLIDAIFLRYNHDFRGYSSASVKRRITQALLSMQCESVSNLQSRILAEPEAFTKLLQFLTVPTSEMFRDPEYYLKIRHEVVPVLKTYPSLKIWVAGCSTGEEVYSFAILLSEEGLLERTIIYATDINPVSLAKAEQGIFNTENIKLYSANYQKAGGSKSLSDYYHARYDVAKFDRALAQNVVFADHSLATDSVFSETQMVSCRNVLIYFDKKLQDRAFGLFHDSLCYRGFLGIGSKESLRFSALTDEFSVFAPQEKIYQKAR